MGRETTRLYSLSFMAYPLLVVPERISLPRPPDRLGRASPASSSPPCLRHVGDVRYSSRIPAVPSRIAGHRFQASWAVAGRSQQLVEELAGGVVGFGVEVVEAGGELVVGALDGVGAVEGGLQAHDAAIEFFGLGVPGDCLLERGEGWVEVAGLLVELGEAGGGVDGAPAEILAGGFDPLEAFAFGEGAVVGGDRLAERGGQCRGVGGAGGGGEGGLEAPEIAVDEVGVDGVLAPGVGDDPLSVLQAGSRLEGGAEVAEDGLESFCAAGWWGVGP